jgi:hypothetical protein
MNYNALEIALHNRLETVVTSDLIKYPNVLYASTQETAIWIRPFVLFGSAESATLGKDGLNEVRGIYQVSVFAALGTGSKPTNDYVKTVLEAFPKGDRLLFTGGDAILGVGYQSTALYEESYYHVPVTIPFIARLEV